MGDLLHFPLDRVRAPGAAGPSSARFFFDVSDPFSYLAAERVERVLGEVDWVAVDHRAIGEPGARGGAPGVAPGRRRAGCELREAAQARAAALHLPLVWPDRFPSATPCALRAADFAVGLGSGPAFALALGRLAFCGGFDLEDPEVIAEAAAAAAVPLGACLAAAGETWRDGPLRERASALGRAGIDSLPAFAIDGRWLSGEHGLTAADTLRGGGGEVMRHPLAPVG